WHFNGWAKYDNHSLDERVGEAVEEITGLPRLIARRPDRGEWLVLEGGGIETDGAGTLMVTEEWLVSDIQVRNPGMTRADYESAFAEYLGITNTIWLGNGCVGDDTHGHIDDIARFASPGVVLLAYEENPNDANHASSVDNLARLEGASSGGALRIVKLPYPRVVIMDGQRLPASYANFYIANGIVIVPTFNDPKDRVALEIIAREFPGREVVGIHSLDLVWGLGTLHCLSQQQPSAPGNDSR
ncbi:MAG: agmatine deiminase family protein, partial [Gemmatimonadaceae bacterium]